MGILNSLQSLKVVDALGLELCVMPVKESLSTFTTADENIE
jgi:hypothetical protein